MEKILTLKEFYQNSDTSISVNGMKFKINSKMSQKQMNTLYSMGYTEFFDVVDSVSLISDDVFVLDGDKMIDPNINLIFKGVEMSEPENIVIQPEPTPTPVKKKDVRARVEGVTKPLNQRYRDN